MQKLKTWEEKTLRTISKTLCQVERHLEKEDVQVCASRDGGFIDGNHESIQFLQFKLKTYTWTPISERARDQMPRNLLRIKLSLKIIPNVRFFHTGMWLNKH